MILGQLKTAVFSLVFMGLKTMYDSMNNVQCNMKTIYDNIK